MRNRRGRERRESGGPPGQLPWARVTNPFPPLELLRPEQLDAIDDAAFTILEEIGLDFLSPEAMPVLRAGGADVEPGSQRVHFGREVIREWVGKAPQHYLVKGRDPARDVGFGGNEMVFSLVASAPNCSDLEHGRRPGSFDDFCRFVRLGEVLNAVHVFGGYPVEPVDLPAATRHLDCQRAFIELGTKPIHAYSLGRRRILDAIELVKLGHGIDDQTLEEAPRLTSIINTSSPLRLDGPMIEGMLELAARLQCCVITPFTLSGAMAPATVVGAIAQQHAEALAGIAFYQMIRAGAPCAYGGFTSNVDMKSGAPAFGTPEYFRSTVISGQLARRWRLPYRSSNVNAANSVDAQAAYESMFSLWACVAGGANFIKHAAGWLEGGLVCSLEKTMLDADLIQMIRACMEPVVVDSDALGLDAMREVGPGGHYFGAAHTLARFETAFHAPMISDWRNFQSWQEAGSPDAARHAHDRALALLDTYEQPPLDSARKSALDDFVERRKREGGVLAA
ncbi:MAG: trimethylamine methyltransferase family protein [Geminicoccaceae bacterium]|nr:trimethylamine methyltransferase family protein [Geminicoccaceae bacterium]